jgi:hypothetical protein
MQGSLKVGESMMRVRSDWGEPDIVSAETAKRSEQWSYAVRPNSNDLAATLLYTSTKEGDKGRFLDLTFVDGKLMSWREAQHTMPSKNVGGFTYGFTQGGTSPHIANF